MAVGANQLTRIVIALGTVPGEIDVARIGVTLIGGDGRHIARPVVLVAAAGNVPSTQGIAEKVLTNRLDDGALTPLTPGAVLVRCPLN
jgi:hypothetical protein